MENMAGVCSSLLVEAFNNIMIDRSDEQLHSLPGGIERQIVGRRHSTIISCTQHGVCKKKNHGNVLPSCVCTADYWNRLSIYWNRTAPGAAAMKWCAYVPLACGSLEPQLVSDLFP